MRNDILRVFPYITQELASEIIPNKDDMSVMKIMTHSGQHVTAYTLNGSPIFFQVETQLYPTGLFSHCHLVEVLKHDSNGLFTYTIPLTGPKIKTTHAQYLLCPNSFP